MNIPYHPAAWSALRTYWERSLVHRKLQLVVAGDDDDPCDVVVNVHHNTTYRTRLYHRQTAFCLDESTCGHFCKKTVIVIIVMLLQRILKLLHVYHMI